MTSHLWRTPAAIGLIGAAALIAACSDSTSPNKPPATGINSVQNIVVIYMENHSFDNEYGFFPGANGIANAGAAATQLDSNGVAYTTLNQIAGSPFPLTIPNGPFDMTKYVPLTVIPPDLVHRYYQEQYQIDGGKMDKFANISDVKGESMANYPTMELPLAAVATAFTLCDNFFHSAFGGSFLNHQWLISAQTPVFNGTPPTSVIAVLNPNGSLVSDGFIAAGGPPYYDVNTSYSVNTPHPSGVAPANLVPNLTDTTIGDRLSAANVSWTWFSGGWDNALAGNPDSLFQFHHQPFIYYANYADGTPAKALHLKDETHFIAEADSGTLPAVSFVKPIGEDNEHPGYANVLISEEHTIQLLEHIQNGPQAAHTVVFITYDEHGGFWDHVAPPVEDKWGPGSRVPMIIVSPYAKKGFVDKTQYETVSILAFIEKRYGLKALSTRDAAANPFSNAFTF